MPTIQEALSTGSVHSLGPVIIKTVYELKQGANGPYRGILISDDSGQTIMTLWGQSANSNIAAGQSITLQGQGQRGGIKANNHPKGSDKWKLDANECVITINTPQGSSVAQRPSSPVPSTDQAASVHGCMNEDQIVESIAGFANKLWMKLKEFPDLPIEVKVGLCVRADEFASLRWFGKKWPGYEA